VPGGNLADFVPAFEAFAGTQGETPLSGAARWQQARIKALGLAPVVTLLRSHGQGATGINALDKADDEPPGPPGVSTPYANALVEAAAAVTVAARYGRTVIIPSVFWSQGEADRLTISEADYRDILVQLAIDYDADIRAITGQAQPVKMYVSQLAAPFQNADAGDVSLGQRAASLTSSLIKIAVPNMACQVIDWAIQAFGGGGTSNDFGLAAAYATARLLRLADGPDEVHRDQLARLEFKRQLNRNDAVGVGDWQPALSDRALGR
jgi:hypothetical protein